MATIVRWNPVRDTHTMQNAMDRFFNDTWRGNWRNWNQLAEESQVEAHLLALDVYENDSEFTVVTSLPGVKADAIDVKFHDGFLTIEAEMPEYTIDEEDTHTHLRERAYGKFSRRLRLRQPVNIGEVEATYTDGVLTLALPKAEEAKPRMIPVKVNGANQ
jgi:HSP20 family protein